MVTFLFRQTLYTQLASYHFTPTINWQMEDNNFTLSEDINGPLLAAVIGIEMVAGLITNLLVLILTACHLKTWKQPSTIFLTNMLLNYLAMIVLLLPISIITCASGEWIFGTTLSQKMTICRAIAYIFLTSIVIATESLTLLSFDRFIFIVKSFWYKKYMTVNKAMIMIAVSWFLAIIICSPLYVKGGFEFSQSSGLCVPAVKDQIGFAVYGFVVFSSLIMSIIITSMWTYCYTRKYLKKRNTARNHMDSVYLSQKRRLIGLFGMLIIIHVLCYTLLIAFVIIEPFKPVSYRLYAASFVLTWLMTILSPLAQAYFRYEIRSIVQSFLIKIRSFISSCNTTDSNMKPQ